MFATGSAHGVELMSDIAYRYEQSLKEEQDAGVMTLSGTTMTSGSA